MSSVSIDDVARTAGVSTATVSRALSGRGNVAAATRARVEAAVRELGYVVSASASSLATGRTRNIGVLLPFVDQWYFSTVLSGISAALMRHGYDVTLYPLTSNTDARAAIFETFLRRQRVDGVISVSIELEETESAKLAGLGIPIVSIGGPTPARTTLAFDNVAIGRLATEHLLRLGHRAIAFIGAGPEFERDYRVATQRREGFEQAMTDAGAAVLDDRVAHADYTLEGGSAAASEILDGAVVAPTAIFAASDEMAIGAILAARERGLRVPEDLSVVGVDGHELGEFFRLTTVDQFPVDQGERAAEAVLALLQGEDAPPRPLHGEPFELVVRGTTSAPRG